VSVESPCIKVCTLDAAGRLCLGCFRTLEEIGRWAGVSDAERTRILARLPERRARHEAASASPPPGWAALRCERCGAGFVCGAKDAQNPCWCASYPAVTPSRDAVSCLCPECLAAART